MIIALSGPSGIGKGFVKEAMKAVCPDVQEISWYTTRDLRPNELTNSNRKHISEEELEEMSTNGELALVQGMFGHRYAVKKQDLLPRNGMFLTEVHPYVVEEAKKINPDIVLIGLVTDDFELLRDRLVNRRKTESEDEVTRRIESAKEEVSAIRKKISFYNEIISVARDNEREIAKIAQEMFAKYKDGDEYVGN